MENEGVKDIVVPLVSTVHGMAADFRQMKDMVKGSRGPSPGRWGDEGWGYWAGGEGYCEEGSPPMT